jgi:hypothetical protein
MLSLFVFVQALDKQTPLSLNHQTKDQRTHKKSSKASQVNVITHYLITSLHIAVSWAVFFALAIVPFFCVFMVLTVVVPIIFFSGLELVVWFIDLLVSSDPQWSLIIGYLFCLR